MPEIKDVQAVELELMKYFDEICRKNNLKYTLVWGTLLGAIRHHGFIPWDDDTDILMSVEDFCIFKQNCVDERYFLQYPQSEIQSPYEIIKLRKKNTFMPVAAFETEGLPINHGIYVDIFLYTNAGKTKIAKKFQHFILHCLCSYRSRYEHVLEEKKGIYQILCNIPHKHQLFIDSLLLNMIYVLGSKKSKEYFILADTSDSSKNTYQKKWFDEVEECQFENSTFLVSKYSHSFLCRRYGDNYMTPIKWSHHSDYSDVLLNMTDEV